MPKRKPLAPATWADDEPGYPGAAESGPYGPPGPPDPPSPTEPWEALREPEPASDSEEEEAKVDPGQEYVHHMLQLFFRRKIVAGDLCIAMHWAAAAGLEAARVFAKPPGLPSGRYADFLKRRLGHGITSMFYELEVPGFEQGDGALQDAPACHPPRARRWRRQLCRTQPP